jgi:hypothetical protein
MLFKIPTINPEEPQLTPTVEKKNSSIFGHHISLKHPTEKYNQRVSRDTGTNTRQKVLRKI